ncbi:hypothetical protein INR75_06665 [Zunongwangia sp. SCSIO 43204]|uniref:hypothetical protein n=1 Tax=Zunongwangia sp. SCSIO 43204 TaxID=2779359 RepID=UPI001CA87AB2|nr:hypothetical protein [Zunongwangia sp. SCSIO 43204]UAB85691.1 hypothetical protein INR75_06665 [Zunongwangia sp. SCSIO 43204]
MADKIQVFKLDIDIDSVIQSASAFKTQADVIRGKLKQLKDAGDTGSETYVRLKGQLDNVNAEYRTYQREVTKLTSIQGKEIKTVQEARNALSVVSSQWAKQAQLYGANSDAADKLAKKKLELTERLKTLESQTGDNTRNVGNYAEGMGEALKQSTLYGQAQQKLNAVMAVAKPIYNALKNEVNGMKAAYQKAKAEVAAYSGVQKAAAITTGITNVALKAFKIALIATGIGAIVVLLGSLVAWFTKTQTGIDLVNKVLAGLGAAFDVVIDRVAKFGGGIVKLLSGDWKGGLADMKDSFAGVGDEILRETKLAAQLEAELQKLQRQEIAVKVARSEINKQIKEQNKIAEDTTKTFEERQKAINKAISLEQEQIKIENDLANNQLKNALQLSGSYEENADKIEGVRQAFIDAQGDAQVFQDKLLQIGFSNTLVEDVEKIGDAIINNNNAIAASEEKLTTLTNKRNTIEDQFEADRQRRAKQELDRRKRATDALIAEQEAQLKLYEENNRFEKDQLKVKEETAKQELDILKSKLDAQKLSQTEYNAEVKAIENDLIEYREQKRQEELERRQAFEDQRRQLEEQIRLENTENELERAELQAEMDFEKHVADLENMQLREEEKTELLTLLTEQREQAITAIREQFEQKRISDFQKLMDKEIKIREKNAQQAANIATQLTGILTGLLGDSLAAKLASIAIDAAIQAGMVAITTEGAKAQNLALAAAPGPPANIPLLITAAAQNLTLQAQSSAAITKILASAAIQGVGTIAQSAKFEKGGFMKIGGKRHSGGGTKFVGEDGTTFEAEQGELIGVINRNAAFMVEQLNSQYPAGGAIKMQNYLAAGGIVTRNTGSTTNISKMEIDYDLLARKIGAELGVELEKLKIFASIEEIRKADKNYMNIQNGAIF